MSINISVLLEIIKKYIILSQTAMMNEFSWILRVLQP